jgi:hypothetical protein
MYAIGNLQDNAAKSVATAAFDINAYSCHRLTVAKGTTHFQFML